MPVSDIYCTTTIYTVIIKLLALLQFTGIPRAAKASTSDLENDDLQADIDQLAFINSQLYKLAGICIDNCEGYLAEYNYIATYSAVQV